MSVSNIQNTPNFQIIQSNQNRLRIGEQTNRNAQDDQTSQKIDSKQQNQKEFVPMVQSADSYNKAYSQAQRELGVDDNVNKPSKATAYQNVQDFGKRDSLSQMLGISVYA